MKNATESDQYWVSRYALLNIKWIKFTISFLSIVHALNEYIFTLLFSSSIIFEKPFTFDDDGMMMVYEIR